MSLENRLGISARQRLGYLLFIFLLCLSACDSSSQPKQDDAFSQSSLAAYNFTSEGIQEYFVDGAWGSGVGIGEGGGSVCCVLIPRKWHPGLQVTVEWKRSDCGVPKSPKCNLENARSGSWPMKFLKKTVPIEPYTEPDAVQVFFLPHDEIKIYSPRLDLAPWHPEHPSRLFTKLGDIGPHPLTEDEFKRFMQK